MAKRPHEQRNANHRNQNLRAAGPAAQPGEVRAPFRFAPIGRWVHEPVWGQEASHDHPFADGVSGEIELEIVAKTPLLVGGARRKAEERAGEVWPFQLPNGVWAIPGATLQGHFRSVLEVATFGRLGQFIEDRRFGLRDVSGNVTSKALYLSRFNASGDPIHPKVKAGWLVSNGAGAEIVPCELSRIHINEVRNLPNNRNSAADWLAEANDAKARLNAFLGGQPLSGLNMPFRIGEAQPYAHQNETIRINYSRCVYDADGTAGTLVLTGKAVAGTQSGRKKWEFVFHSPERASALASTAERLPVANDVMRDFRFLHDAEPGRKESPAWTFWKPYFNSGEPIPVFYLIESGKVASFGMAYMFKAAHTKSTHELLAHSAPDHVEDSAEDFPSLVFGRTEGTNGKPLKRRASFDAAASTQEADPPSSNKTVLLGPKPSYYPIYVRQPGHNGRLANNKPYASYTPIIERTQYEGVDTLGVEQKKPELAGVKLWPAPPDSRLGQYATQLPDPPAGAGVAVQTQLRSLPAGMTFSTKLRVHNLRPVELGALLWSICLGESDALAGKEPERRHRIGMGKPYGLGSVAVRVRAAHLTANDPGQLKRALEADAISLQAFSRAFVEHMRNAYKEAGADHDWDASAQVCGLIEAAQPGAGKPVGENAYMTLQEYQTKKKDGIFLPVYKGGELARRWRGHGGGSGEPEPEKDRRVRMTAGGLEGKIEGPNPKAVGEWFILIDGNKTSKSYKRHVFTVLE